MRSIEQLIEEAIRNGEFRDLPGEGRRLALPDTDAQLFHELLMAQGFSLSWIEAAKEIEAELEAARRELAGRWEWFGRPRGRSPGWQLAVRRFAARLDALNRKIQDYNLSVPLPRFQRRPLVLGEELDRLPDCPADPTGGVGAA
jgi:hypothetical protein